MSLTIWKDVPSLTIFSYSMFIFLIGLLLILASTLQEMRIKLVSNKEPKTIKRIKRSKNANRNYSQLIIARTMSVTSSRATHVIISMDAVFGPCQL